MNIRILGKPVVTEKSMKESELGRYVFYVDRLATKGQIVQAFKDFFDVDVVRIHTITLPGQKERTGKRRVLKKASARKKALVTLKAGQKIAMFESETKAAA